VWAVWLLLLQEALTQAAFRSGLQRVTGLPLEKKELDNIMYLLDINDLSVIR
jgi:hypothetical protein